MIFVLFFPAYFVIVFFFAGTLEWPVAGFCFFSRPEQRMLRLGNCCVTSEQEELLFTVILFQIYVKYR